ncbi:MAG: hypothetical protein ABI451_13030 [Dokdonella sp.]
MNLKSLISPLPLLGIFFGVLITGFTGNAIARRAGFGAESWLMSAFALGIILITAGTIRQLRQGVRELRERLDHH